MSFANLDSELYVELSDQQQELVAGGGQLIKFDDYINTEFEAAATISEVGVTSGPGGSTVLQRFETANVDTSAYKHLFAYFD